MCSKRQNGEMSRTYVEENTNFEHFFQDATNSSYPVHFSKNLNYLTGFLKNSALIA